MTMFIVEYQVSSRGEGAETITSSARMTDEQFAQWLSIWGREDSLHPAMQNWMRATGDGGPFFFYNDLVESGNVNKARQVLVSKVEEGATYILDTEEGMIAVGHDFDKVVAAMRKYEDENAGEAECVDDFDTAVFVKPD